MQAMCTSICTGTIPTQFSACIFNYNFFPSTILTHTTGRDTDNPFCGVTSQKTGTTQGSLLEAGGKKIVLSNQQRLRISCLQTSLLSEKRGGEPVGLYRCFQTFPTQHPRQTCQTSRFDIQTPM